ncbi:hypothetical protein MTR67_012252 [Solanum verrucosum]|uniref:Uncharacterized protein n=1 Tax=Solanum verrucosum TaxID=315347 RepID=A0AAF0Q8A9_SOLVR|nr:hypothetical protein MTR67_012252 [Solanum verrucosum]
MMVTSHIKGLMDMVVLSFDKDFPEKVPLTLLSSTKKGCLTLSPKEMVMGLYFHIVVNVDVSMCENV